MALFGPRKYGLGGSEEMSSEDMYLIREAETEDWELEIIREEEARENYAVDINDKVIVTLPYAIYEGTVTDIEDVTDSSVGITGLSVQVEDSFRAANSWFNVKEHFHNAHGPSMSYDIMGETPTSKGWTSAVGSIRKVI